MKRIAAIALLMVCSSPVIAQAPWSKSHCTVEHVKEIAQELDKALIQSELVLSPLPEGARVFFDVEQNKLNTEAQAGRFDEEHHKYISSLPHYERWRLYNTAKLARSVTGQLDAAAKPVSKGRIVQLASMIPVMLHYYQLSWNEWFLYRAERAVSAEVGSRIKGDIDGQITAWGMLIQKCGNELASEE